MFRLSVKGRYGVLAMLALTLREGSAPLSAKSIAQKEHLSVRFLEQAMNRLKEQGLVESVRGPHGGYRLTQLPQEMTLARVLRAVEGTKTPEALPHLPSAKLKVLSEMVDGVENVLEEHLNSVNFETLAQKARTLENREALMFHI